jgi:hypothetical protein
MHSRQLFLCPILLLWLMTYSLSQTDTATVSGRVTDQQGAVVPAADLVITSVDTNLSVSQTSNKDGLYVLSGLKPGRYRMKVTSSGFRTINLTDIVLNVQDTISQNFQLQVGSVSESVTVVADEAKLNSESGAVSTVVDRQFVENIPLNGRSFQSLIQLSPGVVLTKATSTSEGQFSVNGQRADANYFTVDGVSANLGVAGGSQLSQAAGGALPGLSVAGGTNNLVSVDAMQEFRIQTSTYAPEFGRSPGAQIQIATRSGTNQFHGTAFDYFRNDVLDANNWFNGYSNNPPLPKARDRQNDFGGVFGGPLWRDHTFVFFSYEGLRLQQPLTITTQVPSLAIRQTAVPQMQPFLNLFPLPNGPNGTSGFAQSTASFSNPSTLNATSVRIDQVIGSKLTIFGRYNYAPSDIVQRGGSLANASLSSLGVTNLTTQTLTFGATWLARPTISNDFRFNWSGNKIDSFGQLDNFGGATPLPDSALFPSFASPSTSGFLMFLNGGINAVINRGGDNATNQRQLNAINNVALTVGAHQLKIGFDYRRTYPIYEPFTYASEPFFNGATGAATGKISIAQIVANAGNRYPLFDNYSSYGQDTWKATPRLTLTYGLRWDINPAPHDKNGNQFTVSGLDNPSTMTVAPIGTELWRTTFGNFAPRFGAAYQLSDRSDTETVLRGGIGIFYDLGYGATAEALGTSWPSTARKLLPAGTAFPFDAASAAAPPVVTVASPASPADQFYVAVPNLELPRTYEWNVAIERALGSAQSLTASYIGALGRQLLRQDILFKPNPNFGTVYVTRNSAESNYQAMQIEYNRRLSHRIQALASYTWAHSLDNASTDVSMNAPSSKISLDQERGPSDFDIRHSFTAALTYNLPAPSLHPMVNFILRNWALDGIYRARSSPPVNVVTGTDVFNLGGQTNASRPDVVPGVPLYIYSSAFAGGKRFNPAAFSNIAAGVGRQGTLGRNALRGFALSQLDFTLRRKINLTERVNLQFRAEFFNLLNHPNFADPQNNLSSSLFGQTTQMLASGLGTGGINGGFSPLYQVGGPRSIQLALKLSF